MIKNKGTEIGALSDHFLFNSNRLFKAFKIDLGLCIYRFIKLEHCAESLILREESAIVQIEVVVHDSSAVVLTLRS